MQFLVIDFEAEKDLAGNHFPTEIGLCRPGFRPISSLIRPQPEWRVDERTLFDQELWRSACRTGRPVDLIVSRFPHLAVGCQLISDAACFDQRLMDRLGLNHELLEFFPVVERLAMEKNVSQATLNKWINEIDNQRETSHRAGEDAWVRAELLRRVLQ